MATSDEHPPKHILRKNLNWPNFNDEPWNPEKQQVWHQQSYIQISAAYLTHASKNQTHQTRYNNNISCKSRQWIYRDKKQPQKKETSWN